MSQTIAATYPMTETHQGTEIAYRLMTPKDEKALLRFANTLTEEDLLYLRTDITQPEVIAEWVKNIRIGRTTTLIAEEDGHIVGYGSLHSNQVLWTRHIGEIRVLVAAKVRGLHIGRSFVTKLYTIAKEQGLDRIIAQIASNQPRVRHMFENLGFEPQALLTDWLRDRSHRTHDLIIMSQNVVD